jgi:competence protein ComGF
MINNIEQIKGLLHFEAPGDFYMLYVFKRKKDQPEGERDNHQSVRTIKTYCIESIDHLDRRYDEIKQMCEMFKARAYIHVQKQNHSDVSLEMMMQLAQRIKNGQPNQKGLFDSVVGQIKTQEKRWIVDIDTKDERVLEKITKLVNALRPEGDKVVATIPTKNGYHLITNRFDVLGFQQVMNLQGDIPDIQKKNPTLLYYPDSLDF